MVNIWDSRKLAEMFRGKESAKGSKNFLSRYTYRNGASSANC